MEEFSEEDIGTVGENSIESIKRGNHYSIGVFFKAKLAKRPIDNDYVACQFAIFGSGKGFSSLIALHLNELLLVM